MTALTHRVRDILWQGPGAHASVVTFTTEESFSKPSSMTAVVRTSDCLSPYGLVGATAGVTIAAGENLTETRPFRGIVAKARQLRTGHAHIAEASEKSYLYEFELRAPIWVLTHTQRSRVYQKMTVQAIVSAVLGEAGISFSWRAASGTEREYCVQYEESDLNFVTRLLEAEGMYYFQDHVADAVVIADSMGAHKPCRPTAEALYDEVDQIKEKDDEVVQSAEFAVSMGTGAVMTHDYNHETSRLNLAGQNKVHLPGGVGEVYEHNTLHTTGDLGQSLAKRRTEAIAANLTELTGTANCRSFAVGSIFHMRGHYLEELNDSWLISGLAVTVEQGHFHCTYRAVTTQRVYRPKLETPEPRVFGLQTAVVTGPPGSKVYLDQLGRCKLQFHWDREGEMNDRSSMWVRVSNNYAGKDYGIQFIPRVGHEVLVEYLKGNPDHPIVVGRVYNDNMTAPLGPTEKYQNAIKTIKDHHIIMDDSDGKELMDIRSQKDLKLEVVNDSNATIGHDKTTRTGNNQLLQVGVGYTITVGANQAIATGGAYMRTTALTEQVAVGQHRAESVGGHRTITVKGDNVHTVTDGNYVVKVPKGGVLVESPKVVVKCGSSKLIMTRSSVKVVAGGIALN